MAWLLFALALAGLVVMYLATRQDAQKASLYGKAMADHAQAISDLQGRIDELIAESLTLQPLKDLQDVAAEATRLRKKAQHTVEMAQAQADALRDQARVEAETLLGNARRDSAEAQRKAGVLVAAATAHASRLSTDANADAHTIRTRAQIAADALRQRAHEEAETVLSEALAGSTEARRKAGTLVAAATAHAVQLGTDAETKARTICTAAQIDADALRHQARTEATLLLDNAQNGIIDARRKTEALLTDANAHAARLVSRAEADASVLRQQVQEEAAGLRRDARDGNAEARRKSEAFVIAANDRANRLIIDAEARAQEIAGDAYRALNDTEQLERTAIAMRNVIEGYGDRYLKPTYSLLDQLAEDYGFDETGRELKQARANSKSLIDAGRAAVCDYVERNRRDTAIRFVLDAFNGKVDTILGRVKSDNAGTLEQQVRDAFSLVIHNGSAFRGARITPEYLASRLDELKWAAFVTALRERDREEQRRIREQMRDEDRARREIERALRDAAKEEDALQRAMAKVQEQVAKASEEQKIFFQAQLSELQVRLAEAEAKNQRALSMAQQTKAGHVYVISNVGSFGEQVFKVGMTRRLEPQDRVRELGDASVPFPFDVHAMIWAEDAPALENALHKQFLTAQVNKVNPRKEFFRVPLSDLRKVVEDQGLQTTWTLTADARQYRETLVIEKELATRSAEAQSWLQNQMAVPPEELAPETIDE